MMNRKVCNTPVVLPRNARAPEFRQDADFGLTGLFHFMNLKRHSKELPPCSCRRHNADWYKDPAGPYIGHVYERTWTLLFDCYKGGQEFLDRCNKCDDQRSQNCEPGDCQCRDEVHSTERTASIKIKVKHKQIEA